MKVADFHADQRAKRERDARLRRSLEVALAPHRLDTAVREVVLNGNRAARSLDDVLTKVRIEWERANG